MGGGEEEEEEEREEREERESVGREQLEVTGQFRVNLGLFQDQDQSSFRAVSVLFQSNFSAILVQF